MKYLTIHSDVSLAQLEGGVQFTTAGHSVVGCTVFENIAELRIDEEFVWTRADIKELIQFLKAVRMLLPKESE